jgi:AcrR family transcriptional regulator
LDEVMNHFMADGLGDLRLRQIAAAVGSSHRMLLYHFGSKDGLLTEVVREVEARARAEFRRIGSVEDRDSAEVIRQMWRHVADPAQGGFERLFFALYGRALQGDERLAPLLGEVIDTWLDANVTTAGEVGIEATVVRAHARLGIAVIRGLLLDLLASGDRKGVDAALELFASRYTGRWWEDQPPAVDPIAVNARAS